MVFPLLMGKMMLQNSNGKCFGRHFVAVSPILDSLRGLGFLTVTQILTQNSFGEVRY